VRDHDRFGDVLKSEVDGVAPTETVTGGSKSGDTIFLESGDDGVEDGASPFLTMIVPEPGAVVVIGLYPCSVR
jgi:hypothetical protein